MKLDKFTYNEIEPEARRSNQEPRKKLQQLLLPSCLLTGVNMDADDDEEDGDESKVYDGVDENGGAAGPHVAELYHSSTRRDLEQQTWRQKHEQHHRDQDRSPIGHLKNPNLKAEAVSKWTGFRI
ncbi:unnamed protein product [Rhodiola kirilowii]